MVEEAAENPIQNPNFSLRDLEVLDTGDVFEPVNQATACYTPRTN